MNYTELNISVRDDEQADIFTALLADYPFDSFMYEDDHLSAYIINEEYALCHDSVVQLLAEYDASWQVSEVEQQNWNQEWESGFEPVSVGGKRPILIRAVHHDPAPEGVVDVIIAPRMSFGTGHHATTALMSQTIAGMDFAGKRGLDMGCGTGVLAIVALKCGAKEMVAVDIDDWACASCRESGALSGVEMDVRCGSMDVVKGEKFDFVLANINRNILLDMMPSFAEAVDAGGCLLMSGFLREDVEHIERGAVQCGFVVESVAENDGWMVVVCKKS